MNVQAHPFYRPAADPTAQSAPATAPVAPQPFPSPFAARQPASQLSGVVICGNPQAPSLKPGASRSRVKIPVKPHESWEDLVQFAGGSAAGHNKHLAGTDASLSRRQQKGINPAHISAITFQEDRSL